MSFIATSYQKNGRFQLRQSTKDAGLSIVLLLAMAGAAAIIAHAAMVWSGGGMLQWFAPQPPAVVKVVSEQGSEFFTSSGVVIREDLILTCAHAVRGNRPGHLQVIYLDGRESPATVLKVDKDNDLAVLKIPPTLRVPVTPGVMPVRNQAVVIHGFPKGIEYKAHNVTVVGFIANTRNGPNGTFVMSNRVQQGVSGGPVTDEDGRLVGVLFGSTDYAYATGVDTVRKFLEGI